MTKKPLMWHQNILETIGNTPMVQLHRIAKGLKPTVLAKVENTNPGSSIKDRIALSMIEDAEESGRLKPGATILEWTAGNTGIGLALVAAVKGYKSIMVMPDKVSQEKIDLLRALGSEVVITPTAVKADDPRSCYSVVEHLAKTIPNSFYPNQFENPKNPEIHYQTTGPEIWEQTEGKITHLVSSLGTGGTITGIAKYLKMKKPSVTIIGVDPVGSAYTEYFRTGKMPAELGLYKLEGMGGSKIPKTVDFRLIDQMIQVRDADGFNAGRDLSRMDGIFAGGSSGATMWATLQVAKNLSEDDVIVAMITDSGERYVSKMYNEIWMKENNFQGGFEGEKSSVKASAILSEKKNQKLVYVTPETPLFETFELMKQNEISQVPIISDGAVIGSISENKILNILIGSESAKHNKVVGYMEKPFPVLSSDSTLDSLTKEFSHGTAAVMIAHLNGEMQIITKSDLIAAITA